MKDTCSVLSSMTQQPTLKIFSVTSKTKPTGLVKRQAQPMILNFQWNMQAMATSWRNIKLIIIMAIPIINNLTESNSNRTSTIQARGRQAASPRWSLTWTGSAASLAITISGMARIHLAHDSISRQQACNKFLDLDWKNALMIEKKFVLNASYPIMTSEIILQL